MPIYSNSCLHSDKLLAVHQDCPGHPDKLKDAGWNPKTLQSKFRWERIEAEALGYVASHHVELPSTGSVFPKFRSAKLLGEVQGKP